VSITVIIPPSLRAEARLLAQADPGLDSQSPDPLPDERDELVVHR
jgi:hypothetical protein